MLPTLETWDLAVEPITARSRLYSLVPTGIGTAFVESLSGYVERLAEAHAVSVGSLVGKEISSFIKPDGIHPTRVFYAINGVGHSAKRWVQALETMTSRQDLRYLTLLPLERLFPRNFLFRGDRAWCPLCYELMSSQGGPVYEHLLWFLKLAEVCPRHHCFLTNTCAQCLRSMRPMTVISRPGFCARCGQWLGSTAKRTIRSSNAVPTEYQLWLAEAIAELLANLSRIEPERVRDRARECLLAYTNAFTEGNWTAVADVAGCQRAVFYSWLHGDTVPRIDILLRTWYRLKLPVACLVDGVYPGFSPDMRAKSREIRNVRRAVPRRSPGQIRRALETALREEPAPALHEIARRLGYTTTAPLRSADRDVCRQIILKHRKSGRSAWWRKGGAKPICELSRMKGVLEQYLTSSSPIPSLYRIAADLGYAGCASLWKKFPELCRALWARTAEQKRMRVAAIEPALEQALQETPPPSLRQMARRLGFSGTCVLKAHAPALCEKVKARWQSHAEECRTDLGIKLAAALDENPPPSLTSVYARFGVTEYIVNASFPGLRRKIGLRHLQYQKRETQVRRDAVWVKVREIVRMLHARGVCPSVPRVRTLLKSSLPCEWGIIHNAVTDARRELWL